MVPVLGLFGEETRRNSLNQLTVARWPPGRVASRAPWRRRVRAGRHRSEGLSVAEPRHLVINGNRFTTVLRFANEIPGLAGWRMAGKAVLPEPVVHFGEATLADTRAIGIDVKLENSHPWRVEPFPA